eukprot:TRINITY_DN1611_c0_g1_i1.p1 TRINITY_DN1611_c0_g1~~TRINITY_DN1611_c0_g1_i1.p1  ORF type:complete len:1261 (-),score=493.20 TRINITY_DN1611_c0_g1_i1:41-3661(-)
MVFIKRVLIQGFKSYKEQLEFDEFDEKVNTIVGRNGAGKSNFFFAIRFVLSDMFANLRSEERQLLLHEGSGDTVMSGFVEIHFDNKDGRFPIDKDEVVLRRAIGIKKDEYFLDKKHVTKHDVINFLESAGFSRSNPYYIVQQGRVSALTLMKDVERFELLKEVAGTRVYEERKAESLKIRGETDDKRNKIEETLKYIQNRLSELEDEGKELTNYLNLDKERRALEYNIYDKELSNAVSELQKVESRRSEDSESSTNKHREMVKAKDELRRIEKETKAVTNQLELNQREKQALEQERQDLIKTRAKLELDIRDNDNKISQEKKDSDNLKSQMDKLDKEIASTKAKLDKVLPQFQKQSEEYLRIEGIITNNGRKTQQLYSKLGRTVQFKTKKERDDFIKKEVKQLKDQIKSKEDEVAKFVKDVDESRKENEKRHGRLQKISKELEAKRNQVEGYTKELDELKKKRDDLSNQRKESWKQDAELDNEKKIILTEMQKAERQLSGSVNRGISQGLSIVMNITKAHKIQGVFGPLFELFECDPSLMTAIEVTAGNSLFHVVVDNDDTAAQLLDLMSQDTESRQGRVTFMPLNRLNVQETKFPESRDGVPLVSQLKFQPRFKKAFLQIFGKTLVCQDMSVATTLARQYDCNCVTIAGDQVSRKGAMTGGYHDIRFSKLACISEIKKYRQRNIELAEKTNSLKTTLEKFDAQITQVLGDMNKLEGNRNENKSAIEKETMDVRNLSHEMESSAQTLLEKEVALNGLKTTLEQLKETSKSLESEIGTELNDKLTKEEQNQLLNLNRETDQLKSDLIKVSSEKAKLESEKNELESALGSNLKPRKEKLTDEINSINLSEQSSEIDSQKRQLDSTKDSLKQLEDKLKELESAIEKSNKDKQKLIEQSEVQKNKENEERKNLQKESEKMEKLLNQRSLLLQKKDEFEKKIRDIGSLPIKEVENHKGKELKKLMKRLHEVNQELKQFVNVNKKALDQKLQFTEQTEKLRERKEELDRGADAIEDLLNVLEKQKDEAIERTFKGVAKHFSEIFLELVPGGFAGMSLTKKQNKNGEESQDSGKFNQYSGISIRVSFSGAKNETYTMNQLSGGQKSVVALALIFAIQRCDAAPFYLFDEIDSALDSAYRSAVARLIRKQSEESPSTQFIATTFRPELVKAAHKHYGITYQNKESRIGVISEEEALATIQEQLNEQQSTQQSEA